jgi:hypothetical protein
MEIDTNTNGSETTSENNVSSENNLKVELTCFKDVPGVNEESKTLIKLIENILETNDILKIDLKPDEIELLKLLMKNFPSTFQDIENCIKSIVEDSTINASDIPKFIALVKDFYLVFQNMKETINNLNGEMVVNASANIIKFILEIVLKKYDLYNDNIIKICNDLIDTSVDLLLVVPQVKNSKCKLFFCF